jgi:hypothetical protein
MTKDEILSYAAPTPSRQSEGIQLAYQHATVEAIEAKTAQIKNQAEHSMAWHSRWANTLLPLIFSYVLAAALLYFVSLGVAMLVLGLVMAAVALAGHKARKYEWEHRCCNAVLESLQPIAGSDACQEALEFIEADAPGVATWRDIALNERGQLYHFDVDIMRRLHAREEYRLRSAVKPIEDAERQRLNEIACRKVHGLAPLSLANA